MNVTGAPTHAFTHEPPHDGQPGATRARAAPGSTDRQRAGVAHAVRQVVDALAPERPVSRHDDAPEAVRRHRSRRGCVLQGDAGAVSVAWFPAARADVALGELQVIAWRGVVSLPGSAHRAAEGAWPVAEVLFRPVESAVDGWAWRAADGHVLEAGAVVAWCFALLAQGAAAA